MQRVLVAEDGQSLSQAVAALLCAQNCEVDSVRDGKALDGKMHSNHYDLIVLDTRLPGMTSSKILAEDSKKERRASVLFITYQETPDVHSWLKCNGNKCRNGDPVSIKAPDGSKKTTK